MYHLLCSQLYVSSALFSVLYIICFIFNSVYHLRCSQICVPSALSSALCIICFVLSPVYHLLCLQLCVSSALFSILCAICFVLSSVYHLLCSHSMYHLLCSQFCVSSVLVSTLCIIGIVFSSVYHLLYFQLCEDREMVCLLALFTVAARTVRSVPSPLPLLDFPSFEFSRTSVTQIWLISDCSVPALLPTPTPAKHPLTSYVCWAGEVTPISVNFK